MTDTSRIDLEIADGIARLVLNRPEKLNAMDAEMVDELMLCCRRIERSEARVVLLSGAGKAFCAGGDIAAWSDETPEDFANHWVRDGHVAFDALARLLQPVIAVLDGHVLGGGLELAACADLRIAETQIKIGQPEPGLGIIPGWSGTQRAVRRFGAQPVRRMSVLGEVFTATEALTLGIVDQVVETGTAMAAAEAAAARVMARSPQATLLSKQMINAAEGEDRERVIEALAGQIAAGSADLKTGLAAFRNKTKPKF
ncbi:enoyl-CoA hydratase/isomerase family protein [Shimia abyssi]|uniref:Enoyl-CoA hydratase/carnithine racemase n=1 Tax=Shimia abyssi TaxID=1662395 RepID=A0A2P8F683_9RHOB|nr:enoyl-CoA hydratase/isomerase family protein [Shimia abyssi]PSL17215.1 enoyl-CoA hydratase/carnithine racemase [Shimia abyssi]